MDVQLDPTSVTSGVGETTAKAQPLPRFPRAQGQTGLRQVPLTAECYWLISSWREMPKWHSQEFTVESSRSQCLITRYPIAYWCSRQDDVAGFLVSQADHKLQSITQEM